MNTRWLPLSRRIRAVVEHDCGSLQQDIPVEGDELLKEEEFWDTVLAATPEPEHIAVLW